MTSIYFVQYRVFGSEFKMSDVVEAESARHAVQVIRGSNVGCKLTVESVEEEPSEDISNEFPQGEFPPFAY